GARPADLVDLVRRVERSSERVHHPPAHTLRPPLRIRVLGRPRVGDELALEARLLAHLAESAILVALAVVGFALRKRPVVIARPVNQQHAAVADDESAGGADDAHPARSRARQAARHDVRASARRARSRSTRRPAASAWSAGASTASARSRSSATTESWCSPSTSWNAFARFTTFASPASSCA